MPGEAAWASVGERLSGQSVLQTLKDTVSKFGNPEDQMNDVRRLAYDILQKQNSVALFTASNQDVRIPSRLNSAISTNGKYAIASNEQNGTTYASMGATSCQNFGHASVGDLGGTSQCMTDPRLSSRTCAGSDTDDAASSSISSEPTKVSTSLACQSTAASQIPSQEFSKDMHGGVPNCSGEGMAVDKSRVGCLWSVQDHQRPQQNSDATRNSPGNITTLVMQNIPSDCTTAMLIKELKYQGFEGVYNFLYHPLDHQTRDQRSFAFVNFVTPTIATAFHIKLRGTFFKCSRNGGVPIVVLAATEQGLAANTIRYYTRKSESRRKYRARPNFSPVDDHRVMMVEEYARRLLIKPLSEPQEDTRDFMFLYQ